MLRLYHITTKSNARKILAEGFKEHKPNFRGSSTKTHRYNIHFTFVEDLETWLKVLSVDLQETLAILEIRLSHGVYHLSSFNTYLCGKASQQTAREIVLGRNRIKNGIILKPSKFAKILWKSYDWNL